MRVAHCHWHVSTRTVYMYYALSVVHAVRSIATVIVYMRYRYIRGYLRVILYPEYMYESYASSTAAAGRRPRAAFWKSTVIVCDAYWYAYCVKQSENQGLASF